MNITKSLMLGIVAASLSIAQTINISGTVKNQSGTGITGAALKLEKGGQTATTGSGGSFTITTTGIISSQTLLPKLLAGIYHGQLHISVAEKTPVEIITYTLQGKAISRIQKSVDAGSHSIALPRTGTGVYLYKIRSAGGEVLLKGHSFGGIQSGGLAAVASKTSQENATLTRGYVPINDVVAVTKDGYLNYRVIVTNSDTSGIEIEMIQNAGNVTDADGNVYQSVKIGTQTWTVENLRTKKYNDNSAISLVTDSAAWSTLTTPAYCYYGNTTQADSIKKYGALYNWYAVDTKKLAPTGWHVPTDAEWDTVQDYLIANGYNWDQTTTGNKTAKSLATKADWLSSATAGSTGNDIRKNNKTGFAALPGGSRGVNGTVGTLGSGSGWWSATVNGASNAYDRDLAYDNAALTKGTIPKSGGFSVRLVKDKVIVVDKGFIITHVNDNLNPNDAFLMRDGLTGMGYKLVLEDSNVIIEKMKSYLGTAVWFLYHTGHGSQGQMRMGDGQYVYTMATIAAENVWVATCHTGYPTGWMNQMGPTCKDFIGYLDWTMDGTVYDDQAVKDFLANFKKMPNNTMAYVMYQTHWFNPYLNSKWADYSRTSSGIVEYGSRTNKYPDTYGNIEYVVLEGAEKCKVNKKILSDESVYGNFNAITADITRGVTTQGAIEEFENLPRASAITKQEAIDAATSYLTLPADAVFEEAVALEAKYDYMIKPVVLGYQVVFSRVVDGLPLKGTYFMDQISCFVDNNKKVTFVYTYWPEYTIDASRNTAALSMKDAVTKALPSLANAYKGDLLELVDAYPVYGTAGRNSTELFGAYALITAKGDAIIVDAATGEIK